MTALAGLKVLVTADAVGGVWTYALDLARGLAPLGVETTLAVLGPDPIADQRAEANGVPNLTLVATGLPLDWTAGSMDEVRRAAEGVAALARSHDLVHLNGPALAGLAEFDRPLVGVAHSCVRTWWAAVHGAAPLPADLTWRAELVAAGYRACDRLLAPTRSFANTTRVSYGLDDAPIVVRNGRSVPPILRSSPKAPFVLTAGRLWDESKGIAILDRAAATIRLPVRAAGTVAGPNGARIELSDIEALGRLDDAALAAALSARPIFVSPALYEPFGLAVLEAAAAGCALVLSDIATFRELWDGVAVFVPPRNPAALAAAVNALADDPTRRSALGRAAAERAACYRLAPFVTGVAAVYREVLSEGSHPPLDGEGRTGGPGEACQGTLPTKREGVACEGWGDQCSDLHPIPPAAPSTLPLRERVGARFNEAAP